MSVSFSDRDRFGVIGIKKYNEVYLAVRKRLRDEGIEGSDLESRLLAAKASGKTVEEFLRDANLFCDESFEKALNELAERRLGGEPVAYITGEWEFYGLTVKVTPDVLIPRIDTEVLVDAALEMLKKDPERNRVLDLCSGSGCVGMAMAANAPCRVVMVDNSREALAVSRSNLMLNRLTRHITCVEADALEQPPALLGMFDMIVSNPPYIATAEIDTLEPVVRDHEPHSALDGGEDGLLFYREITKRWKALLKPGGYLLYECGEGQAEEVIAIMERNSFGNIRIYPDTLGTQRVVSGQLM